MARRRRGEAEPRVPYSAAAKAFIAGQGFVPEGAVPPGWMSSRCLCAAAVAETTSGATEFAGKIKTCQGAGGRMQLGTIQKRREMQKWQRQGRRQRAAAAVPTVMAQT